MPQVRLLAPWTSAAGPQASGAVLDVSDEEARDLTSRGHASLIEEEKKLEAQVATNAVYDARLQRPETPPPAPEPPAEEPAASTTTTRRR